MYLAYVSNRGKRSAIENVSTNCDDKFYSDGKYYEIDRNGCYPILRVCCSGKCNTYWRTIGRYPSINID